MDTGMNYAAIAKQVLTNYAAFWAQAGIALQPVFDDEHRTYLLLKFGWRGKTYLHSATVHLEIRDCQIWIQNDHTEAGIATDLLEAGVPREDIVLGFRPPELRQYTGFGAGEPAAQHAAPAKTRAA